MTKADLITVIADKLKFPWARAELLVDVVFGCMEQSMSRGERIEIRATRPNYPYAQADTASVNVRLQQPANSPTAAREESQRIRHFRRLTQNSTASQRRCRRRQPPPVSRANCSFRCWPAPRSRKLRFRC